MGTLGAAAVDSGCLASMHALELFHPFPRFYMSTVDCSFVFSRVNHKQTLPTCDKQVNLDSVHPMCFMRFVSPHFVCMLPFSVLCRAVLWLQGERRRPLGLANTGSPRHWPHARSRRLCRHVWSDGSAIIATNTIANTSNLPCNVHP